VHVCIMVLSRECCGQMCDQNGRVQGGGEWLVPCS
jgi:hypothetical protein